jgi:hypothetical protein
MATPSRLAVALAFRHLPAQRRVIASLAEVVARDAWGGLASRKAAKAAVPGPEIIAHVSAPSLSLVRDYVRHVGGDPTAYLSGRTSTVPPHLWPHWSVPVAARALRGIPYRLVRIVNGGCRLTVNAPIEVGAALTVKARLVEVDDDGRRAVLHQQIITATNHHPEAIRVDLYGIVPTGLRSSTIEREAGPKKEVTIVPPNAREVATFAVGRNDGLLFAFLTGDFNPIHWLSPYARAAGFRGPILHGVATMARAMEGLLRVRYGGDVTRIAVFDVRFTRPLPLGTSVGIYLGDDGRTAYVADAPGSRPYLLGTFKEKCDG